MKTTNKYPIKRLHVDLDKVIKMWSKELCPVCFSRDHSTRTVTITFAEHKKTISTQLSDGDAHA